MPGAGGYLLKQAAAELLIGAICIVAAGGIYPDPAVASKSVSTSVEHEEGLQSPEGNELTDLERDVIRHLASGHTYHEIASRLNFSLEILATHKASLIAKLSLHNRAEIVRFAAGLG